MPKLKTIFITIFQGVEAKNILRTDIYKHLITDENVRIVFFVDTPERAEYYQKEFSHPRVIYESVAPVEPKGLDKFFSSIGFLLLRTATTKLRRRMAAEQDRKYIKHYLSSVLNFILARPPIRKLARLLDYKLVNNRLFSPHFDKYKPDAVFMAHLFDNHEINLLREAKRRSVSSIGFINSWDKLTTRNTLRLLPDKMIVFNNIVKNEAIKYADMSAEDIFVSGIPQYDWHINYQPISREEFCKKNGLNLEKKIILYAPMGKAFSNSDWDVIDIMQTAVSDNSIPHSQLFVRFQPNDFVDEGEVERRQWLRYAVPGIRFSKKRGVNWDMSFDDIRGLTDTLANADIFVCYASSISVDAAMFDKPIINIDFEIKEKEILAKSPTFFYQTAHYGNALKTGAIQMPKNKKELVEWINKYLANPEIDREGRKRLVEEQVGNRDGKVGQRIADYIIMKS